MILGFAGKAASGKTTAAQHVAPLLDRQTLIVPMALVLREEVEAFLRSCGAAEYVPLVYGCQQDKLRVFYLDQQSALQACPGWQSYLEEHAEIQDRSGQSALTVRRVLQWWGTEYRRAQDPDYWTRAWQRKVAQYDLQQIHILIDDVRFVNELAVVREVGGKIIKIDRPGFAAGGNHSSETALDGCDDWSGEILNDATLDQFKEKVETLVRTLL